MTEQKELPQRIWLSKPIALSNSCSDWHAHVTTYKIQDDDVQYILAQPAEDERVKGCPCAAYGHPPHIPGRCPEGERFTCSCGQTEAEVAKAEREFLEASIAVWREIDRLSALPDGYHGLPQSDNLRKRELAAWERYRSALSLLPVQPAAGTPATGNVDEARTMTFTNCPICGAEISHDAFARVNSFRCMNPRCGWSAVYSLPAAASTEAQDERKRDE